MIVVPAGLIGLDFAKDIGDPLTGNRSQRFTYELLNNREAPIGGLSGVTGGRIEWHANAAVKAGGKITVISGSRKEVDWLNARVKIIMHIDGMGKYPLGVFIPSAPAERWEDTHMSLDVELLDKCSILDNDYVLHTYALDKDTNVTDAVRTLITSTGEKAPAITDSDETLPKPMIWEPGTSKLKIINELLDAANFFSLRVDGDGAFRVHKRRLPKDRPVVHEFKDDLHSIYTPDFTYERDVYSIPNKVVLIAPGDGDAEGMRAIATNENPKSPYSYQNRGRWIIDVTTGVEATSQEALQERAQARLTQLTSTHGTITITHAPLPWVDVNEVVRFKRDGADIDIKGVVASTLIELDPEALQRTALQEVVDV